jgi:hypothetical protein
MIAVIVKSKFGNSRHSTVLAVESRVLDIHIFCCHFSKTCTSSLSVVFMEVDMVNKKLPDVKRYFYPNEKLITAGKKGSEL